MDWNYRAMIGFYLLICWKYLNHSVTVFPSFRASFLSFIFKLNEWLSFLPSDVTLRRERWRQRGKRDDIHLVVTCLGERYHYHVIGHTFYQATHLPSGSKYPIIGLSLFSIRLLREYFEKEEENDSPVVLTLKKFVLESLNHYFNENDQQFQRLMVSYFLYLSE